MTHERNLRIYLPQPSTSTSSTTPGAPYNSNNISTSPSKSPSTLSSHRCASPSHHIGLQHAPPRVWAERLRYDFHPLRRTRQASKRKEMKRKPNEGGLAPGSCARRAGAGREAIRFRRGSQSTGAGAGVAEARGGKAGAVPRAGPGQCRKQVGFLGLGGLGFSLPCHCPGGCLCRLCFRLARRSSRRTLRR